MKSIVNYPHLSIFVLAWFVADLLIPCLIWAGHRVGILDRPGGHKGQKIPVPFLGGVGIFVAFTVSVCSTLRFESLESLLPFVGVIFGGAVVVTLGFIDDIKPINAIVKLAVLFATTLVLAFFGITINLFPTVLWNLPNILLTLFWIVGVTSAKNSLDNTDGVAGGVAALTGLFVFAIAWGTSPADAQPWLSYLAVALVGSCCGFLRYNLPPARIYLGDNGSFFLGYILATLLVFCKYSTDPLKAVIVPCLILSVPIYDIALATILRIRDGDVRNWRDAVLYCGRDHLAHLLMGLRFSKRVTVCFIYSLTIIGGVTALLVMNATHPALYLAITGTYVSFLVGISIVLGRVRRQVLRETHYLPRDNDPGKDPEPKPPAKRPLPTRGLVSQD